MILIFRFWLILVFRSHLPHRSTSKALHSALRVPIVQHAASSATPNTRALAASLKPRQQHCFCCALWFHGQNGGRTQNRLTCPRPSATLQAKLPHCRARSSAQQSAAACCRTRGQRANHLAACSPLPRCRSAPGRPRPLRLCSRLPSLPADAPIPRGTPPCRASFALQCRLHSMLPSLHPQSAAFAMCDN